MGTWQWVVLNNSLLNRDTLTNISWIEWIVTITIWIIVFFWIISIIRTTKDITARTNNIFFQIFAILIVTALSPILGLPLYKAIRPMLLKKDKLPRRESCLQNISQCHNCYNLNDKHDKYCTTCWESLTTKCKECHIEYPYNYQYCNECGAPNIELNT